MSAESFIVETTVFDGVYPRSLPRATRSPHDILQIVVNKYTPKNNPNPHVGDVSITLLHANGFHKELYEPLFDAILERSERSQFRIRAIWAADMANQGFSGILNEAKLGDADNSRDLIKMFSLFHIPPPVIGIGHSIGAAQILYAAVCQPSLFTSIVAIEPVIEHTTAFDHGALLAAASSRRKDIWSDLGDATKYFTSRGFYKRWDRRVLDLHFVTHILSFAKEKYGLRDLPTYVYANAKGVTLTTTRHQEVYTFLKTKPYPERGAIQFYRDEPKKVFKLLPEVKCPVLYIFGDKSEVNSRKSIERKMVRTGRGDAEKVMIEEAGHLVPYEEVDKSGISLRREKVIIADAVATFIATQLKRWKNEYELDLKQTREPFLPDAWVRQLSELESELESSITKLKKPKEMLDNDKQKKKSRL